MTKQEKKQRKQQLQMLAGARGKIREEYFANGGDMAGWRGVASVIPDKKKKRSKRACRGKQW